jgi:tetratricopeptide (TPR) repeat protein
MKKQAWTKFPHPDKAFSHAGAALKRNWERLHRGDCEPFPENRAAQDAWRAYHAGDFAKAVDIGLDAGPAGIIAANKAAMIYANYLEDSEPARLQLFLDICERCVALQEAEPGNANAWYIHAYALGRYSQGISIVKALAQGLGGKVRQSLDQALKLQPRHADANIALGTWHAEIIDKVGSMVGGLTYGAKKDVAERHFRAALELNPDSSIARTEYANGLVLLFGRARARDVDRLREEAAACTPADAMERLDLELAKELAD